MIRLAILEVGLPLISRLLKPAQGLRAATPVEGELPPDACAGHRCCGSRGWVKTVIPWSAQQSPAWLLCAPGLDRLGMLATAGRGSQSEELAASLADLAGRALGGGGLALGGIVARITSVHGETRE